jgi:hypothetical protein
MRGFSCTLVLPDDGSDEPKHVGENNIHKLTTSAFYWALYMLLKCALRTRGAVLKLFRWRTAKCNPVSVYRQFFLFE